MYDENGDCGLKGDCGLDLDMPLLLENFRSKGIGGMPLIEASSSTASGGTERMLFMLRGDLGYAGDLGGASDLCERVEPLVSVRGGGG